MFIRSLKLRNILSFREPAPLDLKPLNILIGANGSGKSNLIDCIGVLQGLLDNPFSYINRGGGADAWVWKGPKRTEDAARITCQFQLDDEELEYLIVFGPVESTLVIHAESLRSVKNASRLPLYLDRSPGRLRIGGNSLNGGANIAPTESVFAAYRNPLDPTPVTRTARTFNEIRIYRDFDTRVNSNARRGASSAAVKHPLDDIGSNLALVLQDMDFHGSLKRVKQYLMQLSDRFEDIKFSVEGGIFQMYVRERDLGMISGIRLSDGTLKFLCLMAVLLDHDPPPLVCIEEPETGLHPDALALVADALREASTCMQVVVTTHSDALVDRFSDEPENIIVCERDASQSTSFRRLEREALKEWLEEYTLGDLWRRGELGATQR